MATQRSVVELFYYLLIRALFHGVLTAVASFFIYTAATDELSEKFSTIWLLLFDFFVLIHLGLFTFFFGVTVAGPVAALLAWQPYKHGVKSPIVYVAIGTSAALVVPLLRLALDSIAGVGFTLPVTLFSPFGLWFAVSGAVAGWSFASGLNQQKAG